MLQLAPRVLAKWSESRGGFYFEENFYFFFESFGGSLLNWSYTNCKIELIAKPECLFH